MNRGSLTRCEFVSLAGLVLFCVAHGQPNQGSPPQQWQVQGIQAALNDPLSSVRLLALQKIASFSKVEGIPVSEIMPFLFLKDGSNTNVIAAVDALARVGAREQAPQIAKLLKDPDDLVRAAAASALGNLGAKDHAPEIVKLLKAPDISVIDAAASALGKLGAMEQVPEIVKLLKDPDLIVRSGAIEALGEISAKEETPKIAKLLKDPEARVRGDAAKALGKLGARVAAPEIVRLLEDPDKDVRSAAAEALGEMSVIERTPEILKLLKNPDAGLRSTAAEALGDLAAKEEAPEVVRLLIDPDHEVRIAATSALGKMGAKEQVPEIAKVLKDPNEDVRRAAVLALGSLGAKQEASEIAKLLNDPGLYVPLAALSALAQMGAKDQAPEIAKLLKDSDVEEVRSSAAFALGRMGAREQAPEIVKLLEDADQGVRSEAPEALEKLGPSTTKILSNIAAAYYADHAWQPSARFNCYYLTGGDRNVALLLRRVMFEEDQRPVQLTSTIESREEINAIAQLMPVTRSPRAFAEDTDRQIIEVVRSWKWRLPEDDALLRSLADQMDPDSAQVLRGLIAVPWWQAIFSKVWKVVLVQATLWLLLIFFYPKSPWVQALFFWNRWVRRVFGFAYVDLCLTFIPFFRNRLLAPFRDELAAEARTKDFSTEDYFSDVEVKEAANSKPLRISEAIPAVKGQIVLEGESGLGKSTFLRLLVKNYRAPVVYLPASTCDRGVFEAIQVRLQGKASDNSFLKTIIWCGGLSIIIDGLNEVSVETREAIQCFLRDFSKANVILATQPLLWKYPARGRVYHMLPLSEDRILRFLESRYASLPRPALTKEDYKRASAEYLHNVMSTSQSEEDRSNALVVLSNPMDLTTAALILANGENPTLSNLQEQQYEQMAAQYLRHFLKEVPLEKFAEAVYEKRLRDETDLPTDGFIELIREMVAHKLALEQHDVDNKNEAVTRWVFRHDKVRDYFLMQVFLEKESCVPLHIEDPRFRGVYLMLASSLPLEQARMLREILVDRAAETKDHYLSDSVVQILRERKMREHATEEQLSLSKTG